MKEGKRKKRSCRYGMKNNIRKRTEKEKIIKGIRISKETKTRKWIPNEEMRKQSERTNMQIMKKKDMEI